ASNRDCDSGGDRKREREKFVVVGVAQDELVAVVELDVELGLDVTRHEATGPVRDVRDRADPIEFSYMLARARPRAEAKQPEVPPDIAAPHEPDLRVEVGADGEALQLNAIPISRVVELAAITD